MKPVVKAPGCSARDSNAIKCYEYQVWYQFKLRPYSTGAEFIAQLSLLGKKTGH